MRFLRQRAGQRAERAGRVGDPRCGQVKLVPDVRVEQADRTPLTFARELPTQDGVLVNNEPVSAQGRARLMQSRSRPRRQWG